MVVSCTCPQCGENLTGLNSDRGFFCPSCCLGVHFSEGSQEEWVVHRVEPTRESQGKLIHLPFWEFTLSIQYESENGKQKARAMDLDLNRALVAAFKMHSLAVHGNISRNFA